MLTGVNINADVSLNSAQICPWHVIPRCPPRCLTYGTPCSTGFSLRSPPTPILRVAGAMLLPLLRLSFSTFNSLMLRLLVILQN